jgi:hypothetical protein
MTVAASVTTALDAEVIAELRVGKAVPKAVSSPSRKVAAAEEPLLVVVAARYFQD